MTNLLVYCLAFDSNNNLYAGTRDGVFVSKDNGNNWYQMNQGLVATDVWSLEVIGNNLIAGTGYLGVWKRPLSEFIVDVKNENDIPLDFALEQNYPNPFNPSTKINYQIPSAEFVTLKIYNAIGKEVKTLVNEYKQAGTHNCELRIENGELPSGVYFYKLTAGNFSATKKFILMK
jgi:hypothetical protein